MKIIFCTYFKNYDGSETKHFEKESCTWSEQLKNMFAGIVHKEEKQLFEPPDGYVTCKTGGHTCLFRYEESESCISFMTTPLSPAKQGSLNFVFDKKHENEWKGVCNGTDYDDGKIIEIENWHAKLMIVEASDQFFNLDLLKSEPIKIEDLCVPKDQNIET